MKDDFKLLRGFDDIQMDICECRVAFTTEKEMSIFTMGGGSLMRGGVLMADEYDG